VNGYSGTLLTGRVVAFGFASFTETTALFDFELEVTGGSMAGLFAGKSKGPG
jgi:hypothetical protein